MISIPILSLYAHLSKWANENQGVLAILIPSLLLLFGWASGLLKLIKTGHAASIGKSSCGAAILIT